MEVGSKIITYSSSFYTKVLKMSEGRSLSSVNVLTEMKMKFNKSAASSASASNQTFSPHSYSQIRILSLILQQFLLN